MPRRVPTFLSVLALVLAVAGPSQSQDETRVVFGVLAFDGEQGAHRQWGQTIEALSSAIPGHSFELVPLTLDGTGNALESRGLHFLLTNPGHYHKLMARYQLAPLVSLRTDAPDRVRTGNRYGAVIFARRSENSLRRLADLRGMRFGAVAPDAFGGWQLALHTLRKNGLEPARDFEELRFFGFPQSSIVNAVLNNEIDAGTVRTGVLESMIARGRVPEDAFIVLNELKVPGFDLALSTTLVPEWLIAATPTALPDLRREVARTLLDIEPSRTGNIAAWQPPQSLAPVIEIHSALAATDDASPSGDWPRPFIYGVATVLIASLVVLLSVRRFRPAFRTAPSLAPRSAHESGPVSDCEPTTPLTAREEQVLELVEKGQTTKEIARLLSISPKTVEFHRHNLMQKFGASNMADLVHRSGLWRHSEA